MYDNEIYKAEPPPPKKKQPHTDKYVVPYVCCVASQMTNIQKVKCGRVELA